MPSYCKKCSSELDGEKCPACIEAALATPKATADKKKKPQENAMEKIWKKCLLCDGSGTIVQLPSPGKPGGSKTCTRCKGEKVESKQVVEGTAEDARTAFGLT